MLDRLSELRHQAGLGGLSLEQWREHSIAAVGDDDSSGEALCSRALGADMIKLEYRNERRRGRTEPPSGGYVVSKRGKRRPISSAANTPQLEIVAVLGVGHGGASLDQEVAICRSALLYADHMTLASPRLFALVAAMGIVSVTPQTFRDVMNRAVRDGGDAMRAAAESTRQLGEALDALPSRRELNSSQRREKASLLRRFDQDLGSIRETARKNISELGGDELILAIQEGALTLEPLVYDDEEFDELPTGVLLGRYVEVVSRSLSTGQNYPLFDASTGDLARLGLEAGYFTRTQSTLARGKNAATGTGVIDRLPSFPFADMSEVLDIRKELHAPLGRFRKAVACLSSEIDVAPEDAEFNAILNARWIQDVQPALDEIEERIQQDASLRALTGKFAAGVVDPLRSVVPAAGLGSLSFASGVDAWMGAAAVIVAAGAAPTVKAFQERRKAMRDIEKQPYYFLYKTEDTVRPRELR